MIITAPRSTHGKDMEKPSSTYLKELIIETQNMFNDFVCEFSNAETADVTYVCTKKRNLMGIKCGIAGLAEMKAYNVKESPSIRQNCKYYNKFYKENGKINRIDCVVDGYDEIDVVYIAHYDGNRRYLFPYFENHEKAVGYYVIVTEFDGENVIEEYITNDNQIVYEQYDFSNRSNVGYYCINYVPNGKFSILGESEGEYNAESLEYNPISNYVWCDK